MILYQLRRDSAALEELKKLEILPQNPLHAEGMFLAGTIASEQGRNLDAAEYFTKASSMRDDLLFKSLEKLYDEAYSESDHMKSLVHELVPTYKIYKEN